ncbi:hypothetical protein JDV02_004257 [Purpureocillium takamizusanense]|uniref:Uncharacterized protein n=1 Tax=Purpureocillium takamizusanense TaxID=2060973 RepID=A0A9Q8QED1_9HYPO|nr:uncharacterized protein JDV02_004257 [Purpureocillium takamizusanense]UNI17953.1 hypothetical protein JDV02_004257 [Purpureocillium takamizusanense]
MTDRHMNALRDQINRMLRGQAPLPPTTAATRNQRRKMQSKPLDARESASLYLGALNWTAPVAPPPPPPPMAMLPPPPPPPLPPPPFTPLITTDARMRLFCPEVYGEPRGRTFYELCLDIQIFVESQTSEDVWPKWRIELGI